MKLLFVDCCISQRGAASRTKALAAAFLETFRQSHSGARIETADLAALALKPFTVDMLDRRDALAAAGRWDAPIFDLARQFRGAACRAQAARLLEKDCFEETEEQPWLLRSCAWWAPRPAEKRSWACCWPSGSTARWCPPTPCRFTGA
ncbi:hypothetical protein [Dysosmobacter sp.]